VGVLPDGERWRPYEITAAGEVVFAERLRAMKTFATRGLAQLKLRPASDA
jgi:hypothetical protein